MQTVITINAVIMALFFVCYSYQFFYVAVALLKRKKFTCRNENHRIAVLIAARNEENVIGQLLDSIHAQKNYPMDHVDIYVGADNCTDDTARVARERGAIVFERHDTVHVGKGYVLNEMLQRIKRPGRKHYDAYLVLDADNILDPNFISEIEKVYSSGYEIVTCYRNSKNYGDNWISAGYALWFLRESRYLNGARYTIGSSCAVSGTGFAFTREILDRIGSWHFFLLTEDIEFTIDNVVHGEKIGYCREAVLYDEQPTTFRQSWNQRLRWSKGYLQVFRGYGARLLRGAARGSFSCYDMAAGHYAGFRPVGHGHRLQRDGGHSGGRPRGGPDHCPVVRGADAAEYVSDPVCAGGHHHRHRVEAHPYQGGEKGDLRLHLPAVYVYLYSHLLCGAVQQGGVEAHRAPGQRRVPAGPGPGGAATLLTGSLPPVQSEK